MKKILPALFVLILLGAGCQWGTGASSKSLLYANPEFSFAFYYPENMEMRAREASIQAHEYLGLETEFFASLRDLIRDEKPTNIAFFFSLPRLSADEFRQKLEESGASNPQGPETLKLNDLTVYRFVNATALSQAAEDEEQVKAFEKYHYLFDRGDKTIIISVFISEHELFEPILTSLRSFK